MNTETPELTQFAKAAIRRYLLLLVAPLGTVLMIVAFAAGYFIHDVYGQRGANEAYSHASNEILKIIHEGAKTVSSAQHSTRQSDFLVQELNDIIEDANKMKVSLETATSLTQGADQIVEEVANNLAARDDFRDVLSGGLIERVEVIEGSLMKERKPDPPIHTPGEGPWGGWTGAAFCPQNAYICGLEQKIEARQGRDDDTAMNGIRFFCCPL